MVRFFVIKSIDNQTLISLHVSLFDEQQFILLFETFELQQNLNNVKVFLPLYSNLNKPCMGEGVFRLLRFKPSPSIASFMLPMASSWLICVPSLELIFILVIV